MVAIVADSLGFRDGRRATSSTKGERPRGMAQAVVKLLVAFGVLLRLERAALAGAHTDLDTGPTCGLLLIILGLAGSARNFLGE